MVRMEWQLFLPEPLLGSSYPCTIPYEVLDRRSRK